MSSWPKAERRSNLALWLLKCEGNLLHTAFRLGIHRSHLYRLVKEYKLWPVVNELRKRRLLKEHEERRKKYRGGIHV